MNFRTLVASDTYLSPNNRYVIEKDGKSIQFSDADLLSFVIEINEMEKSITDCKVYNNVNKMELFVSVFDFISHYCDIDSNYTTEELADIYMKKH